jgi:CheY-like chemotaxis protein/two-component sensor histidine kinase
VIDGATQAASRATTLVQRLLAFARRQNLTVKTVDMGELLYGIRDLISRSIGPRIKIAMDAEPGLVAQIDAAQFELAILNLAVNARDAMPDGGSLTIKASFHGLDQATGDGLQPGRYVKVCVSDTGQGMAPAVLARAVEPFFSTKGVGKGTGLGLSMVHGLAAQSNGVLRLSSAVGRGTTAELWLPLADEGAVGQTDQQDRNVPAGNGTILLVDDEELVRRATAEMLRDCGYVVVEAASGSEALNCLRKNPGLALLVTDQVMPGMLGSELACAARKIDPDLPVLVITGYAGTENLPPWVEGMHKPFRQDELARAVVRLARSTSSKIVDISQARHK